MTIPAAAYAHITSLTTTYEQLLPLISSLKSFSPTPGFANYPTHAELSEEIQLRLKEMDGSLDLVRAQVSADDSSSNNHGIAYWGMHWKKERERNKEEDKEKMAVVNMIRRLSDEFKE